MDTGCKANDNQTTPCSSRESSICEVSTLGSQSTGFKPQYHTIQVQRYIPVITNMGPEFQGHPQQHSKFKGKLNYAFKIYDKKITFNILNIKYQCSMVWYIVNGGQINFFTSNITKNNSVCSFLYLI